jgi:hypothetical protein
MSKQLFNAAGTTAKISELYALTDGELRIQMDSIRIDFVFWMHTHFSLNEKQSIFLEAMEYPLIQLFAEDLYDCILFRLPLSFTWPPLEPIGSKFVQPVSALVRTHDPLEGYVVTGNLRIVIGYKKL